LIELDITESNETSFKKRFKKLRVNKISSYLGLSLICLKAHLLIRATSSEKCGNSRSSYSKCERKPRVTLAGLLTLLERGASLEGVK